MTAVNNTSTPGEGTADFGMAGLGVMGASLARNISDHGFSVAAWDYGAEYLARFRAALHPKPGGGAIMPISDPQEFVRALRRPRRIMMMVKAGAPVDLTIEQFAPYLEPGDILIDGGNSHFEETRRRERALAERGLRFFGMGVSGGERGALEGASLMPGGERAAYDELRPVLEAIAAKNEHGACVTYIGPEGAGHFVKMTHNGVEYGVMQLIAEAYHLMREVAGMKDDELAAVFDEWNRGRLESYLTEITARILRVRDTETGEPLVESVLDKAGQKGTGKWTTNAALDLGVATPTINAALEARIISGLKSERVAASELLGSKADRSASMSMQDRVRFVGELENALYASILCAYAQGFALLRAASVEYKWDLNLAEIARIWTGGCIIRARLLEPVQAAFKARGDLPNLLVADEFRSSLIDAAAGWRATINHATNSGVPVPTLGASLSYFDSYRAARLPQNLTQAQRDYFGAHTYERIDRPAAGAVHTEWEMLAQAKPVEP